MGRVLLLIRLVVGGLRRRPVEAVLMVVAIAAATATLTLGLALHSVSTNQSYAATRAATAGPDAVATNVSRAELPGYLAQARAPGVIGHSGPYPVASVVLRAHGIAAGVEAEGRPEAPVSIDRPEVTSGSWVHSGGVVIERSFAEALGLHVGDLVTLDGRSFRVVGVAVTAASPPYPETGYMPHNPKLGNDPGLAWLTEADARSLATPIEPLIYTLSLRFAHPSEAQSFVNAHGDAWTSWQQIADQGTKMVANERLVLLVGSWLLGLLALASMAVLVGGRMVAQTRRVGLLKAVGGTPGLVAAALLTELVILALAASAAGLVIGWLATPLLTNPSFYSGLVGTSAAPAPTLSTVGVVVAGALAVTVLATLLPAIRASRTSTVQALADAARPPKRRASLIAISTHLPVSLLLGLRHVARRTRRAVLSGASVAITVTAIVTVLIYRSGVNAQVPGALPGLNAPAADPVSQIMAVLSVALLTLAAVNAIFIAVATVLDARRASALSRALGATPRQVSVGTSAAQLLPALPGAVLGIPAGIGLYTTVSNGGAVTIPPVPTLIGVVVVVLLAVSILTAIPSRFGARRPVAEVLQAEVADGVYTGQALVSPLRRFWPPKQRDRRTWIPATGTTQARGGVSARQESSNTSAYGPRTCHLARPSTRRPATRQRGGEARNQSGFAERVTVPGSDHPYPRAEKDARRKPAAPSNPDRADHPFARAATGEHRYPGAAPIGGSVIVKPA
jgi:ABC-type lipoprotein release transport system permease subunit